MATIMIRCISSFEHGVVLYMPIKLDGSETLADVARQVCQRVKTEPRYKPLRAKIDTFDTFKIYVKPGQAKPANLTISPVGDEFASNNWGKLTDLNIEYCTELSFFCGAAYERYKESQKAAGV